MFKTITNKIKSLYQPKEVTRERLMKDLLRENLDLMPVDIFYIDDPRVGVPPDKLVEYDKKFYDICRDKEVMDRFKYLINRQARMTIENSKDGHMDALGGININGMATVKDDFTRLANCYLKEIPTADTFNKHSII